MSPRTSSKTWGSREKSDGAGGGGLAADGEDAVAVADSTVTMSANTSTLRCSILKFLHAITTIRTRYTLQFKSWNRTILQRSSANEIHRREQAQAPLHAHGLQIVQPQLVHKQLHDEGSGQQRHSAQQQPKRSIARGVQHAARVEQLPVARGPQLELQHNMRGVEALGSEHYGRKLQQTAAAVLHVVPKQKRDSREGPGERRLRNEQRGQAYGNYGNGISVERRTEQLYLLAARSEREQGEQGAGEDIGAVHKDALDGGQQEEECVVAGAVPAQVSEANCDGFWSEGRLRPESEKASQNYDFVAQALILQVTGQQQTQVLD
jgi:hypothetical protein